MTSPIDCILIVTAKKGMLGICTGSVRPANSDSVKVIRPIRFVSSISTSDALDLPFQPEDWSNAGSLSLPNTVRLKPSEP